MNKLFNIIFLFFITGCGSSLVKSKNESTPWKQLTITSLKEIHDELEKNHPGSVDQENLLFKKWLNDGYLEAIKSSSDIQNFSDAKAVLFKYINGFQDGHVILNLYLDDKYIVWAGIGVEPLANKLIVKFVSPNFKYSNLRIGDELVSCDGHSGTNIYDQYIQPSHDIKNLKSSYLSHIPYVFINDVSYGPKKFSSCIFSESNRLKTIALNYQREDRNSVLQLFNQDSGSNKQQFEIKSLSKTIVMVKLPTLHPKTESDLRNLKKVIREIPKYRSFSNIILDLRGNMGGNSQWGDDLFAALYSKEFYNSLLPNFGESKIEYRVSEDNLKYLEKIIEYLKTQTGDASDDTKHFKYIVEKMKLALTNKLDFVKDDRQNYESLNDKNNLASKFNGRLWALTDHQCFSSCLIVMDRIKKLLPNTIHIGLETSADTAYMEVSPFKLSHELGQLLHPIKVNRAEYRKNNQPYTPKYEFDGDIKNDLAVELWLINLIKSGKN